MADWDYKLIEMGLMEPGQFYQDIMITEEDWWEILKSCEGKPLIDYCMACHQIRLPDGTWGVPEQGLDNYTLSHGYCEPCGEKAKKEARAEMARWKK